MKQILQWTILGLAIPVLVFVSVRLVHGAGQDTDDATDKKATSTSEKEPTGKDGAPGVHLSSGSRNISGVRTVALTRTTSRAETQVAAIVLSSQELLDLRTGYIAAAVQVEKARASEHASRLEYQRLSQLNKEDQNASDKAVQAAEATYRTDAAALHNAEQVLTLAAIPAQQHWGPVVSKWITSDAPVLNDVLEGKRLLLQATLPSGATATQRMLVKPGERTIDAFLLSPIPRVDSRFQTPSYLYIAQADKALAPGMNIVAFAPGGSSQQGVLLPREAVLSWQGKNWVYLETAPGTFLRKEVLLDTPLSNGWFIRQDLTPGDHVVITGAQQLLSEEFRSQSQTGDTD